MTHERGTTLRRCLEFIRHSRIFVSYGVSCEIDARDWVRICPVGSVVTKFGYFRYPLFLTATTGYSVREYGFFYN